MFIIRADEGHCFAAVLCACRTPDPVYVVLRRMRHIVLDDQWHINHIYSPRHDIRRYQHGYLAVLEIEHHLVALMLLQVAVHRTRVYV